jgi:glucose/mannose-6-phosphate isomerase
VAVRWKGQFNENAKQHAFANVLPEQNHNEILAWTRSQWQAPAWSVLYLRDRSESPQIAARVEVTREVVGNAAESHDVFSRGRSLVARMLSLVYLADFVTVYLAHLNEVDPTDIAGIDRLKAELSLLSS